MTRGWLGDGSNKFGLGAFLELHIEQGPILEREGLQIAWSRRFRVFAGWTWTCTAPTDTPERPPLDQRQDALLAASAMIVGLNALGRRYGPAARVSVGRITTATDGPSTIVGHASLSSISVIRTPTSSTG